MKKIILATAFLGAILFTGCGTNGINLSQGQIENAEFSEGKVVDTKKVLVAKGMMNTLTGVGLGAGAGAILGAKESGKNALKGGLIGAVVGAGVGYATGALTNNNEVEAYRTSIVDSRTGSVYSLHLEDRLREGTIVEYVKRGNEITNVNVVRK